VKHAEHGAPPAVWANPFAAIAAFIRKTLVIAELEARKLRHDPTELFMRAVQPALWLLVFGQVFGKYRWHGSGPYQDFLAPGILAQSVLFIAIFYGITIIWERDLGLVHKMLVSPTPRSALVLGKALSAGVRAVSQVVLIYVLSLIVGVHINWNPLNLIAIISIVVLGAACFSTLSLVIACLVKTRERFMGIGQLMTMPLFFASNAIYPIEIMPTWLKIVAKVNPLTYQVDALRGLMVVGGQSHYNIALDLLMLIVITTVLVLIGSVVYRNVVG
jgi:ABC-2 type transport system permease protein